MNKCAGFWSHAFVLHHSSAVVFCGWNFPLAQALPYLELWSPSFAPRLPCKYSSRIKGATLAIWPLVDLPGPISYHSSSVACQGDCIPVESVWGKGGFLWLSCIHPCARDLPSPTIQQKFEPWHRQTHKGALKSGPTLAQWKKYVWVIEGEIWPPWALKRVQVNGLCHLNREDGSV